jgi:hypothetical protein
MPAPKPGSPWGEPDDGKGGRNAGQGKGKGKPGRLDKALRKAVKGEAARTRVDTAKGWNKIQRRIRRRK